MLYNFGMSLLVAFLLILTAGFCTSIYLHRAATHRALILHPAVAWVFRFALWITTGLSTKQWVAVHRKHHAFTDEEGDPHSPRLAGFWTVQLWNVFLYRREARNMAKTGELERYSQHIVEDWTERHVFNHGLAGVISGTAVLCLIMGLGWGLLAASIHGVMYVFVLSSSINGLCHTRGYKNFDNTATNQRLLALITGGEGLHNNHHAMPGNDKFSWRFSEFDPSWPIIKLLYLSRLAKPNRRFDEAIA